MGAKPKALGAKIEAIQVACQKHWVLKLVLSKQCTWRRCCGNLETQLVRKLQTFFPLPRHCCLWQWSLYDVATHIGTAWRLAMGAIISISVCAWAIPWEEFKAAWISCGKSGKISSTWATIMSHSFLAFCAHGVEGVLVPLASTTELQVQVAIVGDGSQFLIQGGAAMEHSLAKLAQMSTTQAEKPFLATWWAQSAL